MSNWQPDVYLTFEKERTQPSIDLVNRIELDDPKRIIDIGCGPGNSTMILRSRWPDAEIIGLDNSETMISEASSKYPDITWLLRDASDDLSDLGTFDLVFSNAAIHWIPEQEKLLQKLFGMLKKNGVFAAQIPNTAHLPFRTEIERLVKSKRWESFFVGFVPPFSMHSADYYYDILCRLTTRLVLWQTDYYHVMDSHLDIVKWSSGTALQPYVEHLADDSAVAGFKEEYALLMKAAYPPQPNGKILFPFSRVFFVAREVSKSDR